MQIGALYMAIVRQLFVYIYVNLSRRRAAMPRGLGGEGL